MTEKATKPVEPEEQENEQPSELPEKTATGSDEATEEKTSGGSSFASRWGWLLLLLVAIGAGLLLTPAEVRQQWFGNGTGALKPGTSQPPERVQPPTAPQQPAATAQAKAQAGTVVTSSTSKPVDETEPRASASVPSRPVTRPSFTATKPQPAPNTIDNEEAAKLLDAMNSLQAELNTLRQEQQELRQTQGEMQKIQLRTRLRWIANPINHLPQIELAWQEISAMPTLGADERVNAQAMYALAQQRNDDIRRWQRALHDAAIRLRTPAHENIIPEAEHPWLQWLFGQFSLRRAPDEEARQMAQLRHALLDTARNLPLEQWPEPLAWQKLRARVQLLLAEQATNNTNPMPELPDNFAAIAKDIEQLRQSAQAWQERL